MSGSQPSKSEENPSNSIAKNEGKLTDKFSGTVIKNKCLKYYWYTGQSSTGICFTHRVILAIVWVILYLALSIILWNEFRPGVSRLEAFLYCSLSLMMIYIGCIILIKIIRRIPKNEYILAKPKS